MDLHTDVAATDATNPPAEVLDMQVIRHVLWFYGDPKGLEPGHFTVALLTAFAHADRENLSALRRGFPVEGYWTQLLRHHPEGMQLAVAALDRLAAQA